MADVEKKKKGFRKYTFRGKEIDDLVKMSNDQLIQLFPARQRRRFQRGLKHKYTRLIQKIRKAKKNVQAGEKPAPVKTHLRNAIIVPEMVGSVIGIYNGKDFLNVEIKFDMISTYLAEYAMTYKPCRHGKPGVGATKGSANVG